MSVWKKAAKANQKTHRERHQPEERKHLGLLEKKKDYKKRASDYNEKRDTLKLLRKRALNKNPDEFYHHMINSKTEHGKHFEIEKQSEETPQQLQLMNTQDLKYITFQRTQEARRIDKLQAQLHLASVDHNVKNKHIRFDNKRQKTESEHEHEHLADFDVADVNVESLGETVKKQKNLYMELDKRIKREKQLAIIQRKLEVRNHVQNGKSLLKPKLVQKGLKERAPVYKWKYERQK